MTEHSKSVQLAYHLLMFLVPADATREQAEAALDSALNLRDAMSFAVRSAALEMFEPERVPVAGLDYLPCDVVTDARVDEILDILNGFVAYEYEGGTDLVNGRAVPYSDRVGVLDEGFTEAMAWAKGQPDVALTFDPQPLPGVAIRLVDGTVLFWDSSAQLWAVAAVDTTPADFVSEHGEAVSR